MVVAHCLNCSSLLQQRTLILHFISGRPRLDLIAKPLQLLDFALQVVLELIALGGIVRRPDLLVYPFESLNPFCDLFKGLFNLLLRFPGRHVERFM